MSSKPPCYCHATRAVQEFFRKEVQALRRSMAKPFILLLDSLDYGVPSSPQGWDLIYSPDLITGLPQVAARQVLKLATSRLKAGGRLLVANACLSELVRPCGACASSGRNYRTELELAELTLDIPDHVIDGQAIFRDDSGLIVCLELYKARPHPNAPRYDAPVNLEGVIGTAVQQDSRHHGHTGQ